ncbi:MAG: SIR2 family protein [Deltaproteobacteria bacterium]|nr:SIR2 family protein [Deltaproteobacteria bacterium]
MVEFPDALFERIRAGNTVLCTGVRFASAGGLPGWDELLTRLCAKLGAEAEPLKPLIQTGQYLTVAGQLKRRLGSDSLADVLKEAYGKGGGDLPKPHQLLKELPFHAALTTGYDGLMERALARNGTKPRVYSYSDGALLRLNEELKNFVVKAHGDFAHPDKLVLARLDYKRCIAPNQAYRAFVEDLYRTHTLLLVGYRAGDPDFVLLLERLIGTFRDAVTDHYAILSGLSEAEQEELYANYRVKVIPYDESADPATALQKALEELGTQWKSRGAALEKGQDPIQWLKQQLAPVDLRIDVVAGEGLSLSDARLSRISEAAVAVQLSQLDAETLCRLGNVRLYLGQTNAGIECFKAALEQNAKLAEAHLNLHHALAEAGDYAQSFSHLAKATELNQAMRPVPKRYELRAVIGRGTTGTVYNAHDLEAKRDVTVKVLRVSYVREHLSPERWLKETEALKTLEHKHVARVYDALIEGDRCVLVTESLSGRSLARLLREGGALVPEKAAEIMGQVCQGLEHAHGKGVLHLDLQPSNIFLRDDGTVALMDFRAGRAQKGRHVTVKRGSEGHQSPEVLAGSGADARADIYSLGATLYQMLTNRVPVGSFPRLGEASAPARRFEPLVNKSLRALPEERPQTVAEFSRALAGTGEGVAIPERADDLVAWLEVLTYQPDNQQAQTALDDLERQYRGAKDWDDLVTLLLGRVEVEGEPERRIAHLREVARVFESEVGDLSKAFAALQAAFREDHSSIEVRKDLERLAGATGTWNELLQEYTTLVQQVRDPKVACDWWVRMGRLYSNELGHDDYAAAALGQALLLDANRLDALAELAEVVRRKGDHKEYVRLVGRQVQLEQSAPRKLELLKDLARAQARELGDTDQAVATYQRILELEPTNVVALKSLEELHRKAESFTAMADVLKARLAAPESAEERLVTRHALAELAADRLQQPELAIEQYQAILEVAPDDVRALKGLERLYDATGRNEDYLKVLDKRIKAAKDDAERIALYRRIATEWEGQSGGKTKAAEYLEKVHQLGGGNEESFKSLVRLYWELKDYPKLAEAYQQQVKLTERPEDRVGLYAGLGKVYEDHLKDPTRAIEAFNGLLTVDAENKIALAGLARLYEATGAAAQAVAMYERLATKEQEVDKQVECYHRVGLLQLQKLRKEGEAEASLAKALELKDDHVPSLLALAELYQHRKDYGKAARFLREAGRHSPNLLEKVARLHQAAVAYQDQVHNDTQAAEIYEELLALDPEHVEAGQRLLALYERQGQPEKTLPLLQMLARKADPKDRPRLIELNLRLGDALLKASQEERAVGAYRAAYELDPTSPTSMHKLADLLFLRKEHEEAGKLYQALLVHRRDSMASPEVVEVFLRLGEIKMALGETAKALNMFEKALDLDPSNAKVLSHVMHAYQEKGDWEAVVRCKKNMVKGATDEVAKLSLLEEVGDLLVEKLKRLNEAAAAYKQAVELKPDHRRVLHKLLEVHIEQKRWEDCIAVLTQLERLETDGTHSYRLHYTAAVILRDELKRPQEAARHLDLALQADPTNQKAFTALKQLYTEQGNYKGLVQAFRLMLKRLPAETPVAEQVRLWHELGQICQEKLQDAKGAIVAFEVAAKIDPTNVHRLETLARLYATAGPEAYAKAVQVNQRLLRHNPMRLEAYRELRRLYGEAKDEDKSICVSAVLNLLKLAGPEEQAYYQKHRAATPKRVQSKLGAELWRGQIEHPRQSPVLSDLFGAAAPVIGPMAMRAKRHFGLRATEQLHPDKDQRLWARAYRYAAEAIGHAPDELYVRGDMQEPLSLVLTGEQGKGSTVLWVNPLVVKEGRTEGELTFWFGKTLALLRPEHVLAFVTPAPAVLRAVVLAAVKLLAPTTRVSGDVDYIQRLVEVLRTELDPRQLEGLGHRTEELRAAAAEGEVERWLQAVDLSASRAALLLSGDLEAAARLLIDEAAPAGTLPPKERVAELMAYAVSEEYFKARELLGLKLA